jgi:glucose-1-phosphate thymidylyltransferase
VNHGVRTLQLASATTSVAVVDASAPDRSAGPSPASRYLTPIANRPLISHVVESLVASGIRHVFVVASARGELCAALHPVVADRASLSFIDSSHAGRGPALVRAVRRAVDDRAVVLQAGDCLFPGDITRLQDCFCSDALDAAILVRSARSDALAANERSLVPVNLPREQPQGTALMVGPSVWPHLEMVSRVTLSVPRLADSLRTAGYRVGLCEVGEHWCYSERTERLLVANRMLLDSLPADRLAQPDGPDNDVQGRVSVCPSARVSRSTLRGPVLIGEEAVVEDSFIGPYTAIGRAATVIGAELDNTMVLAEAEVRYPGYRLEASVIGERAVVRQSFGLPAGMHLRIGPGAQVTLG